MSIVLPLPAVNRRPFLRITSREIVSTGRILSPFSPRMIGPDHRVPFRSCALLTTGKKCTWSWHGYDCS